MIATPKPHHRPKCFITPKNKRPPRSMYVTIAAGFVCNDGLVLCADTQETISGYAKVNTQKMKYDEYDFCNIAFTGAGDSGLVDMTIQQMDKALKDSTPMSQSAVEEVLRDCVVEIFNYHIAPYSSFPADERPSADILLGIQFDHSVALYRAYGTTFFRVTEPQCIGVGVTLGKSLIAQLFSMSLSLPQAGIVALYVLHQAKTWVADCGGNSDILLMSEVKRGITRITTQEVRTLERHFDEFSEYVRPVLISAADKNTSQEKFEDILRKFQIEMVGLRGKFMGFDEFYERLHRALGIAAPSMKVQPESSSSQS
jgi:20S proteasome alpha/beta subunit